jgi:predicted acetyltransferase
VLRELLTEYLRDMAEWFEIPVDLERTYPFDGYDAYLAKLGDAVVGFALIGSLAEWLGDIDGHDVHEFFILRQFRRSGFGRMIAAKLWDERAGEWLVRVLEANVPAILFWRAAISSYALDYEEEGRMVNGRSWRFFRFTSNSALVGRLSTRPT